jgi:hypothetical protein
MHCQSFGQARFLQQNPEPVIVFSGIENHSHSRYSKNLLQLGDAKFSALLKTATMKPYKDMLVSH